MKNIFETRTAGLMGIPFLGYHLISESDFARKDIIKRCVRELRMYYPDTKAILVTKEKDLNKLLSTINEIEFDGVQLHYDDSETQAAALKGSLGKSFIVFQVVTPEATSDNPSQCDCVLIDRSYKGGTGKQISQGDLRKIINRYRNKKVFLAGGISPSNLYQYFDLPIEGFDIQSAVKSENASNHENTDYDKVINIGSLLGYSLTDIPGQVGFVVQDIKQENQNLFLDSYNAGVDFFHIDISDGFVGQTSDINDTKKFIHMIKQTNSHLKLQIHFFVSSENRYMELSKKLLIKNYHNLDKYVHINRDNFNEFSEEFIKNPDIFFGVDVKDITDETYPWEQFIKQKLIVCLQSTEHKDRVSNLNRGLKLIQYYSALKPIITIDRNVDLGVLMSIESLEHLNIVCGSYLRENITERFGKIKGVFL